MEEIKNLEGEVCLLEIKILQAPSYKHFGENFT